MISISQSLPASGFVVKVLQRLLLSPERDYQAFRAELADLHSELRGVELARSRVAHRLALALQGLDDGRAGTSDVSILLRQAIRAFEQRLTVTQELWRFLSSREAITGLRVAEEANHGVTLVADPWQPKWLSGARSIDQLELRRNDTPSVGDGLLYKMARLATYQSDAQKAAVTACLFAPPSSTTLVSLPTGAGKSLCALLPAWHDTKGGRVKGGTTLVVVPTVSLALDQEAQARRFFEGAVNAEFMPQSRTASTPEDVRIAIRNGLRNGTLPLLYTSPEALIGSELYDICLQSAQAGTLNRLVIDEAHLVQSWGAGFRAEFQFLASFRKQLLAASAGRLRTLLFSATISEEGEGLLRRLFSEDGAFNTVSGNRLRPEISYWFSHAATPAERETRVLEALRHLPRPAILYVTRPEDAETWLRRLHDEGFMRVAAFSGATEADERQRVIAEWNSDRRDLMVATSAFGLGVDKPDVRTVIHACLPESMDRFYQEVGRGGRDGCSAISLLCSSPGDDELAFAMTRTQRIGPDKALSRWEGLRNVAVFVEGHGDEVLIDTDARPTHDPEMSASEANREWNEHTLLLMQRAGLIEITSTRDVDGASGVLPSSRGQKGTEQARAMLQVKLLRPLVTSDPKMLLPLLDATRQAESETIREGLHAVRSVARRYSTGSPSECVAHEFARLYPRCALACGGCLYCRQHSFSSYSRPIPVHTEFDALPSSTGKLDGELLHLIGPRGTLNIFWEGSPSVEKLRDLGSLLVSLVGAGFQQVIMPEPVLLNGAWVAELVDALSSLSFLPPHILLPDLWIKSNPQLPVYSLPTVVVYPPSVSWADDLHTALRRRLSNELRGVTLVNVVHHALVLESERGRFLDRINGVAIGVTKLRDMLKEAQAFEMF